MRSGSTAELKAIIENCGSSRKPNSSGSGNRERALAVLLGVTSGQAPGLR
jgi:hypothetical protein